MIQMLGLRGSASKEQDRGCRGGGGGGGEASPSALTPGSPWTPSSSRRSPFAGDAGGCSGWTRRRWPRCSLSRAPSGSSSSAAARGRARASSLTSPESWNHLICLLQEKLRKMLKDAVQINFSDVSVYKIGSGHQAPRSVLPIGAELVADPTRLVSVNISTDMVHTVLAVSYAKEDEIISSYSTID
ncbi:hypothetical protein GUJ93_ZPchr0015g6740 [Zizania palustris]|uniref:Clp1 C-terminal domain-containing protein n=1 Tax=Zizania palustris TaxID=103762 RepID=A0A8J5TI43_ZIZPA|nr:hypothetical protein GUJ93_ZPchr0015g6740 [Zizania palustris]